MTAAIKYRDAYTEARKTDWADLCHFRDDNLKLIARPQAERDVVFMGDSITEAWASGDATLFTKGWVDRGISGQTTAQMLVRFPSDVLALHPRVVHIMAGTNDVAGNTGPTTLDAIEGNLTAMVMLAKANGIRVVIAAIPPAGKFSWAPDLKPVPRDRRTQPAAAFIGAARACDVRRLRRRDRPAGRRDEAGIHPRRCPSQQRRLCRDGPADAQGGGGGADAEMTPDRRQVMAGLAFAALPSSSGASPLAPAPATFRRRAGAQPIITADPNATFFCPMRQKQVRWRALHAFNPAAVAHDGAVHLLFRAEDDSGDMAIGGHTSRIGLARSRDGVHFEVLPAPVIYPAEDSQRAAEWDGGCEDPRLAMREDGLFVCTYSQFNRKAVMLGVATSRDLLSWEKHGVAFIGSRYEKMMMKSAAIVQHEVGGGLIAARIDGRYWMLFGQGKIYAAQSDDMIRWTPVESAPGQLKVIMAPRPGRFDSVLAEVGPPPVLTRDGIVMLYNGKNAKDGGDPALGPGAYAAGRALLDPRDPTRVVERGDAPFFAPELPWEKSGQYAAGTTFAEGLVRFKGAWLLYYGAADSVVGVARSLSREL